MYTWIMAMITLTIVATEVVVRLNYYFVLLSLHALHGSDKNNTLIRVIVRTTLMN
jgi:hypothetical protein